MGFEGFAPAQGLTATSIIESGSAVSGGTANGVMYVDAAGLLATEAAFTYDESTNILTVDTIRAGSGSASTPSLSFSSFTGTGFYATATGTVRLSTGGGAAAMIFNGGNGVINLLNDSAQLTLGASSDVILTRDAANTLAQRNSTNAQAFRIYNTFTDASNYERAEISWASNIVTFGSAAAGTGSLRDVYVNGASVTLRVSGSSKWNLAATTFRWAALGNFGFSHGTSALATTATEGFFHMNSAAGAPTGVPASIPTGQIPMVFDTANDRLYFYYDDGGGAAWHYVARTA